MGLKVHSVQKWIIWYVDILILACFSHYMHHLNTLFSLPLPILMLKLKSFIMVTSE